MTFFNEFRKQQNDEIKSLYSEISTTKEEINDLKLVTDLLSLDQVSVKKCLNHLESKYKDDHSCVTLQINELNAQINTTTTIWPFVQYRNFRRPPIK